MGYNGRITLFLLSSVIALKSVISWFAIELKIGELKILIVPYSIYNCSLGYIFIINPIFKGIVVKELSGMSEFLYEFF